MITIVTGEPRSGTSLMMQTLKELGVPVVGSSDFRGKNSNKEVFDMNPKGFYEIGGLVIKGIQSNDVEFFDGCAIKVVCRACISLSDIPGTTGTSDMILKSSKLIWCIRNPRSVAVSHKNLQSNVKVNTGKKFESANKVFPASPERFVLDVGAFYKWLWSRPDIKENTLLINYDSMVNDTKSCIDNIVTHLDVKPTDEQIEAAMSNVDVTMKRSKPLEWEPSQITVGEVADKIYAGILDNSKDTIDVIDNYFERLRKESTAWVDSTEFESWIRMTPPLYRSFKTNRKGVRDKLLRNIRAKSKPFECDKYSISEKNYTVERPEDIGDLTRNKINCDGTDKTHEQCYMCWERRNGS